MPQRTVSDVLIQLREQLSRNTGTGVRALGQTFRALDSFDGNRKVDRNEFVAALQRLGLSLSTYEYQLLFNYFDVDRDGSIAFDEFLVGVRGLPNPKRQALIDKAFLKFDKDGNGYIEAVELRGVYNCHLHPKVLAGVWTEEQAFSDLLSNFNDRNRDGRISKAEWNEYYAAVSAGIEQDAHFVHLMKAAWQLD